MFAVRRDRHVVRALAVDDEAPGELAGTKVDPDDVGRLGREAIRRRPSLDVYMSSTYWSLPSPISSLIARK